MRAGRYLHESTRADVEDLTDAVLELDPENSRAQSFRRAAAARLKSGADDLRAGGHSDQAIPLLQGALRLSDDPIVHDELALTQHEADVQRGEITPNVTPPVHAPTVRPPVRRLVRPGTPNAPSLVHPPQPAEPLALPPADPGVTFTPGRDPSV